MKRMILAAALAITALPAAAVDDAYIIGVGRWTCEDAVTRLNGSDLDRGQVAGWILGFVSYSTIDAPKSYIDTIEKVGGDTILNETLAACERAPQAIVWQVVLGLIENTQ